MPIVDYRRTFMGWLCATLLVTTSACSLFGPSESALEKGEQVSTGEKRFDDFFTEVAALRDKVAGFDSDLFPVRQPLTEQLELNTDITMPELIAKVRERAEKLRSFGLTMALVLMPTPKMMSQKGNLETDVADERVVVAVEESAQRAFTTFKEFGALMLQATALDAQRADLAEAMDKLPADDPNRDTIKSEIVGAGRVLQVAEEKLLKDSRTLGLYLVWLSEAVDTGAAPKIGDGCPTEPAAAAKTPKKPGPKPQGPGPKGPTPPRPPGGDDFEM